MVHRVHVLGVGHGNPTDENMHCDKHRDEAVNADFTKECHLARSRKKGFLEACTKDMAIMANEIEMYEEAWGSQCAIREGLAKK